VSRQQIFPFYSKLDYEKIIAFYRTGEFEFSAFYNLPPPNDSKRRPGEEPLETVKTVNVTESVKKLQESFGCEAKDIISKFIITLNPKNALPKIQSAWVECVVETVQEVLKKDGGGAFEDVKGFFGYGKKKDGEQQVLGEEDSKPASPSAATVQDSESSTLSASKETKSAGLETKVIKRVEKIPLSYTITKDGSPPIPEKGKKELISK
jgi:hypoxia up-regulated 1